MRNYQELDELQYRLYNIISDFSLVLFLPNRQHVQQYEPIPRKEQPYILDVYNKKVL